MTVNSPLFYAPWGTHAWGTHAQGGKSHIYPRRTF